MKKFYYILITFVMCICTVTLTTSCSKSEMEEAEKYANNGNNGNNTYNGTINKGEILFEKFMDDNGLEYGKRINYYDNKGKHYYWRFSKEKGYIYRDVDNNDKTYTGLKERLVSYEISIDANNLYQIKLTYYNDYEDAKYYQVEHLTFDWNELRSKGYNKVLK